MKRLIAIACLLASPFSASATRYINFELDLGKGGSASVAVDASADCNITPADPCFTNTDLFFSIGMGGDLYNTQGLFIGAIIDSSFYVSFKPVDFSTPQLDVTLKADSGSSWSADYYYYIQQYQFDSSYSAGVKSVHITSFDSATVPAGPDAVLYAVPEPATWSLMLAGFGAIGASMRKRRKAVESFG